MVVNKVVYTSHSPPNDIGKNPLAPFGRNRFNILFNDAGVVYYLSSLIKKFLIDVWLTPNRLLLSVHADVQVPEFLGVCTALSLINRIVTGPLWCVIESKDISILDMNVHYRCLLDFLEKWLNDASDVVSGEAVLFIDFRPTIDVIFDFTCNTL